MASLTKGQPQPRGSWDCSSSSIVVHQHPGRQVVPASASRYAKKQPQTGVGLQLGVLKNLSRELRRLSQQPGREVVPACPLIGSRRALRADESNWLGPETRPRFDDRCVSDFALGTIRSSQMLLIAAYVLSANQKSVEEIINHPSKCRHMTAMQVTRHNRESRANRTEVCGLIHI